MSAAKSRCCAGIVRRNRRIAISRPFSASSVTSFLLSLSVLDPSEQRFLRWWYAYGLDDLSFPRSRRKTAPTRGVLHRPFAGPALGSFSAETSGRFSVPFLLLAEDAAEDLWLRANRIHHFRAESGARERCRLLCSEELVDRKTAGFTALFRSLPTVDRVRRGIRSGECSPGERPWTGEMGLHRSSPSPVPRIQDVPSSYNGELQLSQAGLESGSGCPLQKFS